MSEYERQKALMENVFGAINVAKTDLALLPPSRAGSLATTKLDEAWLWASQIPAPPNLPPDSAAPNGEAGPDDDNAGDDPVPDEDGHDEGHDGD